MIDEAKNIIEGLFEAKIIQKQVGEVEVRKLFKISNNIIAGCYVENGKVPSKAIVKVIRNNDLLFETNIKSLRREKNEVKEVIAGQECGILLEDSGEIKEEDK